MHPIMRDKAEHLFNFSDKIVDVTLYPDIQELLTVSDFAISDYSSCIFDFMLTRKPVFIYANDIETYSFDQGLCYPIESTPFPICKNNYELFNNILNFNYEIYLTKVEKFLKEKGCMEDGYASKRVVDLIEQIMNE